MVGPMLLPPDSDLRVDGIYQQEEVLVIMVSSAACQSACHRCGALSGRVHSHYHRHPRDVPLSGSTAQMDICVRRFFCDNLECQATTFGERMPELIAPHAHRTTRLAHQQQQVALESGGEAGVRVLKRLGMATSPDTLLRLIRKVFQPGSSDILAGRLYPESLVILYSYKPNPLVSSRKVLYIGYM